jgi:hypothetical protein
MIDVEPLIASELERMLPLPDGGRADWSEVLRRAGLADTRRSRWKPLLVAALVVAALVGVGVAIAAGFGAFNGISATHRPQTPADRIDPKLLALINAANATNARGGGRLLPASARLVKQVPGARFYAVATTTGQLCVLAERKGGAGMGCGSPLTRSQPTTAASFNVNHEKITWGITLDGIAAVSFQAGGKEVNVPVVHNVWVYQGNYTGVPDSLTVHRANGNTETLP